MITFEEMSSKECNEIFYFHFVELTSYKCINKPCNKQQKFNVMIHLKKYSG